MFSVISSIFSLLLSYGLLMLANGMFNTLLSLRSRLEGFSTGMTGFVMAGSFVGMLIGAIYAVRLIAAVGHIRAFAALASIMSVAVLTHLLKVDPVIWFILRVVSGFCMAGMIMIVESWLNAGTKNDRRGQVLALYMMTNYLGAGSGQFMLLLANPAEYELFLMASIILSIALVPILITKSAAPNPSEPERMPFKALIAVSPLGVLGAVAAGLSNASLNSLGPVFATEVGLPLSEVSTFMACVIMGGMLLQYPIGKLSDRVDRRTVILSSSILTAFAAMGVLWASGQSMYLLLICGVIYGGVSYTIYPLAAAQLNDLGDVTKRVQLSAGMVVAYGIGASIGPMVSAQLMHYTGPNGLFYFIASVATSLAFFTIIRMGIRQPSQKAKAIFIPLSGIAISSKQLYNSALETMTKDKKRKKPNEAE